ncbi:hypothetical protein O3Q52_17240 [Streptomyces sp. ActVer]|uniref:hypothetical protein n=1 Tax=Streptomyces sp. ActVer TaxID=3014558 RepID=UPI0022B3FFDF|nr:hypothetical protein [Streptomyces sp. ActVer]MCZ4509909.1 hypothetical protein [Streptomyces sp. ActVer]
MSNNSIPQLAPAMALAELLREYPELPPVDWQVSSTGFFSGTWTSDEDVRPLMDAYTAVLGGVAGSYSYSRNGRERRALQLRTMWRDVHFDLFMSCPASVQSAVTA